MAGPRPQAPEQERTQEQQTLRWLQRYRTHDRLYAWGFYLFLLPVFFMLIRTSAGELNQDVFLSFAFVALLTLVLAMASRWQTAKGWLGRIVAKSVKPPRRGSDGGLSKDSFPRCQLIVLTSRGSRIRLRVPREVFDYFTQGELVMKIPGLRWPEKLELEKGRRLCVLCGTVLSDKAGVCPVCRGPVPHHPTLCRLAGAAASPRADSHPS